MMGDPPTYSEDDMTRRQRDKENAGKKKVRHIVAFGCVESED